MTEADLCQEGALQIRKIRAHFSTEVFPTKNFQGLSFRGVPLLCEKDQYSNLQNKNVVRG